jgi:hypothetical protein
MKAHQGQAGAALRGQAAMIPGLISEFMRRTRDEERTGFFFSVGDFGSI